MPRRRQTDVGGDTDRAARSPHCGPRPPDPGGATARDVLKGALPRKVQIDRFVETFANRHGLLRRHVPIGRTLDPVKLIEYGGRLSRDGLCDLSDHLPSAFRGGR